MEGRENRRCADGRVVQHQVPYLGQINASQREAWRKTIELHDGGTQRQVALFPAGSMPVDEVAAISVRLSGLRPRRPRQRGACWLALRGGSGPALTLMSTATGLVRRW